jgi:hypothetical protein
LRFDCVTASGRCLTTMMKLGFTNERLY